MLTIIGFELMNRDVGLLKDELGQEIAGFGISVPASLLLSTQQKLARWHFPNIDTAPNFSFFLFPFAAD